jgi:hypothetical protein
MPESRTKSFPEANSAKPIHQHLNITQIYILLFRFEPITKLVIKVAQETNHLTTREIAN